MKVNIPIILLLFTFFPASCVTCWNFTVFTTTGNEISSTSVNNGQKTLSSSYVEHDHVKIITNEYFKQLAQEEVWPGTGNPGDPIIIDGYSIAHSSVDSHAIFICNTDLHCQISNNYFYGTSDAYCTVVFMGVKNVVVVNNTLNGGGAGFHVMNGNNIVIRGNNVYNHYASAVAMHVASCDNVIESNTFYNNHDGILIGESSFNVSVKNNMIHSNTGKGIAIENGNVTVLGNNLSFNGRLGIQLSLVNHSVINGNYIHDCGLEGIRCYMNDNNNISGNIISGHSQGIYLSGCTSNTFTSNCVRNNWLGLLSEYSSSNNTIFSNVFANNSYFGLQFRNSERFNIVKSNSFLHNNSGGLSQASDDGTGNVFINNTWNDWNGTGDYFITSHFLTVPVLSYPVSGQTLTGNVTLQWSPAIDGLGHSVGYTLYIIPEGSSSDNILVEDLNLHNYSLNTANWPDGYYRFRIKAKCSDGTVNETLSGIYTINNTEPASSMTSSVDIMVKEAYCWESGIFTLAVLLLIFNRKNWRNK
ncbi:MAG: right-handed parallel beta-helix repeat-containing protein [Candidatus Hodarchaeales archaeon]